MKNKRNKLQIKENWDKGLTLSKEEISYLKAGDDGNGTCKEDPNITHENPARSVFGGQCISKDCKPNPQQ